MNCLALCGKNLLYLGGRCKNGAAGMALIELLISIMLFAVFGGIFAVVTEITSSLAVADQPSSLGTECMGVGEDRACIELYFDRLVEDLESSAFPASAGHLFHDVSHKLNGKSQCAPTPKALLAFEIPSLAWPVGYEICIYAYNSSVIKEDLSASPQTPGLYLLQASPSESLPSGSTRQPVQRLFCRPRYLCA